MSKTYKVIDEYESVCKRTCDMRIFKRGFCQFDGIPENAVYQNVITKKLYTTVSDGCECWSMMEVEPESDK